MERIARLIATTIPEVVRSSAQPDETEAWLGEPTDAVCSHCGQVGLRRYERLNGRCERCRRAYLDAAQDDGGKVPSEDCPECFGSGYATTPGTRRVHRCPCRELRGEERIAADFRRAGVPPEYAGFVLGSWRGEVPHEVAEFLADLDAHRTLFIHGAPGRGKTHLATGIFRDLVASGTRCAWRDCKELVARLKRLLRQGRDEQYDEEIGTLRAAHVLLLDDLGRERQTDYSADEIDGLIRWRHSHGGTLIVTSDWSLAGLVKAPPEGRGMSWDVVSRLRGLEIHLTGPDRRAREAK